jgi:hypothetical protein
MPYSEVAQTAQISFQVARKQAGTSHRAAAIRTFVMPDSGTLPAFHRAAYTIRLVAF